MEMVKALVSGLNRAYDKLGCLSKCPPYTRNFKSRVMSDPQKVGGFPWCNCYFSHGDTQLFSTPLYVNVCLWEGSCPLGIDGVHLKGAMSRLPVNDGFPGCFSDIQFEEIELVEAGGCALSTGSVRYLHGREMKAKAYATVPSAPESWRVTCLGLFFNVAFWKESEE